MEKNINKPEWVPDHGGEEYTTNVMRGVDLDEVRKNRKITVKKRKKLTIDDFVTGIKEHNLSIISKAITLIESNNPAHNREAQDVLKAINNLTGNSVRVGITGPPGAGKSTFIEALGMFLVNNGFKVAVLAVDPSSTVTKGSILGDKTRMEMLSREANAFIRPSPSGGSLGGVAKKTRETIQVCEAAGYDVILIETVGVGQSETTVRSMVDLFMLMLLPGSGDELQGIKKGVVELADLLVINKADGDYKVRANITKNAYENALYLLQPATEGWKTKVQTCSALKNIDIDAIWSTVNEFMINTKDSGVFEKRRKEQVLEWVYSMIEDNLKSMFFLNSDVKENLPSIKKQVMAGEMTPALAVEELLQYFKKD